MNKIQIFYLGIALANGLLWAALFGWAGYSIADATTLGALVGAVIGFSFGWVGTMFAFSLCRAAGMRGDRS